MAKKEIKIDSKQEKRLLNKTKKTIIKEGSAYSVMDGFGLRYVTPFAVAIGSNNTQIGLLSSLPSLIGNLSQLATFNAMKKYPRRKIVFWGIFLQSIMWLFLIAIAALYFVFNVKNSVPANMLIIIYTLLIFLGSFGSPAWASWIKDVVGEKGRGAYFGKRNEILGIIAIISMLIAGFVLDYFKQTYIFLGFAILFFIAFAGRAISAYLITKQYEPKFKSDGRYYFTIIDFVKKMSYNNFGRFVLYFSLISLAVSIAGPFFTVYMLKNLSFSYIEYMIILLSSAISTLVFMPIWGKMADKYGTVEIMRINSPMIILIPFLWIFSIFMTDNRMVLLCYLNIIEIFSGIVWAGFNLGAGTFIYDAVSRERLAICISYFNIINGVGVLVGAVLGGLLSSSNFTLFGLNSILSIFILSGIARVLVYITMAKKVHEVREVHEFNLKEHIKEKTMEKLAFLHLSKLLDIFDTTRIKARS